MANFLPRKWKDEYWVRVHELAKSGLANNQIAKAIGVSSLTFRMWVKNKPLLKKTLEDARNPSPDNSPTTFLEYVYKRLPTNLQILYDKINAIDKKKNGLEKIETLLADQGIRVRQQLFIHSLVACNFNPSEACRKVNISKKTFETWCYTDPEFQDLVNEIQWHKKNFFEGALMKLVREGDTSAVLFVNKAFNKDRGYSEKQEIDVKHQHVHAHAVLDLDALEIPLETRKLMLEAIRDKRKPINGEVINHEAQPQ